MISEIISLMFIYFILKQLFLIILIADLIYIFISFILNTLVKQNSENKDKEWFIFLATIEQIKNEGNELENYEKMLNSAEEYIGYDFNSTLIEIWDKLSLIIIYFVSWSLLKNNLFDFSMFFIFLLLKSFSKASIFNLAKTITWFSKYKTILIKFDKMFLKPNQIMLKEEIKEIKIYQNENEILTLKPGLNLINFKNDLGNINKTKNDFEISVYINNKDVNKLQDSNIRQQIYYLNDFKIKFGTIYQNIALSTYCTVNMFNLAEVQNLLEKYEINITKLVKSKSNTQIEKEIIKLLSIFYIDKKVIMLKNNFQILNIPEITSILNIFAKLNNDKFVILF